MNTEIIKINRENVDKEKILIAAEIIRSGGLVAFPTETVYGLGADAYNESAVKKIFIAKGRPSDNPLIVHISENIPIMEIVESFPEKAEMLKEKFWPGPLTLILKKNKKIPGVVTGNLDTVAVRMPSHPVAKMLIDLSERAIAAPSANISGKPSPTKPEHVIRDLFGKIDIIIDAGGVDIGLESTVVDLTKNPPVIYRPGKITVRDIESVLGEIALSPLARAELKFENIVALSPGMKYRHYSPDTPLILYEGEKDKIIEKIKNDLEELKRNDKRVGLIIMDENVVSDKTIVFDSWNVEDIAKNIFSALREMDENGLDFILVQGIKDVDLGLAVMNRLRKAASKVIKLND